LRKIGFGLLFAGLAAGICFSGQSGRDDRAIWKEFVTSLKTGTFTMEQVRPLYGVPRETLYKWLMMGKEAADKYGTWKEWETPEIYQEGPLGKYILTLTTGPGQKDTLCFSLTRDGDQWHFGAVEGILIRLDKTPPPPTSDFPDVPAETKAWQREEIYWSQMINLYVVMARENKAGRFFDLMKDGAGYFVAAKTWVPFLSSPRAFILYLCWEQSRLRENHVVLEKLSEKEAAVSLQTKFFLLYRDSGHIRTMIPFEDYRRLFETIWLDRAMNAGWDLKIEYKDPDCRQVVLNFKRKI
jgi:hypothetical protein